MTIPWKSLALKLGRWLFDRAGEEAVKELERKAREPAPPVMRFPPQ